MQHEVLLDRIVRRKEGREDRGEDEQREHGTAQDDPPARQQAAESMAVRTGGGRAADRRRFSHGASVG